MVILYVPKNHLMYIYTKSSHHYFSTLVICLVYSFSFYACDSSSPLAPISSIPSDSDSQWSQAELDKADDQWSQTTDEQDGLPLRLILNDLQGSNLRVEDFLPNYFDDLETQFTLEGSKQIHQALKGTIQAQRRLSSSSEGLLRIDQYQLKGELNPLKLTSLSSQIENRIPFKMTAGSTVRFIRVFRNESEAERASILTPLDLPFTVEKALALPQGCVVEIPVEAQVSINIHGQLLGKTWQWIPQWASWLSTSTVGMLSSIAQGSLFVKSHFTLWITRLDQDQLRVQISQGQQRGFNQQIQTQIGGVFQARFLPASRVEKVKNFKDKILKWGKRPSEWLSTFNRRLKQLQRGAPRALQSILAEEQTHPLADSLQTLLERSETQIDQALELVEQGGVVVDRAETWFNREIQARLNTVDQSLNPFFAQVKKYSERILSTQARVELSMSNIDKFVHFGIYRFDLSKDIAQYAYRQMVGGQAYWDGLVLDGFKPESWLDLTIVDGLAQDKVDGIECLQTVKVQSKTQTKKFQIRAPLIHYQIAQNQNQVDMIQETADEGTQEWQGSLWRFERQLEAGPVQEMEKITVGFLSQSAFDEETNADMIAEMAVWEKGGMWMNWEKKWPDYKSDPIRQSFYEILNLTGHLGQNLGLTHLYQNDSPGRVHTHMNIMWNEDFLNLLFTEVDEDTIWAVFAIVADTFDNKFGLPYITSFRRPSLSDLQMQYCDRIAYQWGGSYCWWIRNNVIDPFRELQQRHLNWLASRDEWDIASVMESRRELRRDELLFLKKLAQNQLFLNPIGPRLITRFFSELTVYLKAEDWVDFEVSMYHPNYPETTLAHSWGQGNDDMLSLIDILSATY